MLSTLKLTLLKTPLWRVDTRHKPFWQCVFLKRNIHKKVIAFAGCVTEDAKVCNQNGIDAFFPILRNVVTREEAMDTDNAHRNMTDTAEQVFRLIKEIMNEA